MESEISDQAEQRLILESADLPSFEEGHVITIHHEDPDWVSPADSIRDRELPLHDIIKRQYQEANEIFIKYMETIHSEKEVFEWRIVFEEMIINALRHGNRTNPNLKCTLSFTRDNDRTVVHVKDSGPGFDVHKKLNIDCTDDDHVEEDNGRGLMLIQHYMDEVRWNITGTEIAIWKKGEEKSE